MYQIDKNVPLPTFKQHEFPFSEMEQGDSFVIPSSNRTSARNHASDYQKEHENVKFEIRKISETEVRVWRTV